MRALEVTPKISDITLNGLDMAPWRLKERQGWAQRKAGRALSCCASSVSTCRVVQWWPLSSMSEVAEGPSFPPGPVSDLRLFCVGQFSQHGFVEFSPSGSERDRHAVPRVIC